MVSLVYSLMVLLVVVALSWVGDSILKSLYGHYKWVVSSVVSSVSVDKGSSYECSFVDMNQASNTYTMQFFIISLSFMLFDLEILLIVPMAFVSVELGGSVFLMVVFLSLVAMATYYEVLSSFVEFM